MSIEFGTVSSLEEANQLASDAHLACPICRETTVLAYEQMYDDRYGYPGRYAVRRCTKCEHMYLAVSFTPNELTNLYTQYYPRSSYSVDQHRTPSEPHGIRAWLRGERCAAFYWVPKKIRVLDIGCGFCEGLAYHKARGCEAYGVEADANARKIAEIHGYNVHIGLFDPNLYEPEYFDFVTLDQVIEHVGNPREFMAGVMRVLKPGGTVVISTPNPSGWGRRVFRRRWIHWHIPYHLQQFTRDSMRILAESVGLKLFAVRTVTHSEWFHFQLMHLTAMPDCGVSHPFWAGKAMNTRKARAAGRLIAALHRFKVHEVATRILDLLGVGDNQLFILRRPDGKGFGT